MTSTQPATPSLLTRVRRMLKNGDYQRLLTSNALWWQTMYMENVVVGWLVLELTNSPWQVSLVGFCRSVPFLIFGFFAGPLTDRFGRRKVIIAAQAANLSCYVTITVLLWLGRLHVWHMIVVALVLGMAWAVDWPARRALLPDLIGKERTVDAMLMENFAQSISRVIGPAIAGGLIAAFGAVGCFAAMMLLSALALTTLWNLSRQPIPRITMRPSASQWNLIAEGLRYVGQHQAILGVILITFVMNLFYFSYIPMLSVFARDILLQGPVGLGFLSAAAGVGSFFGLFLINHFRYRVSNGWILAVGTFSMSIALLIFARSTLFSLSWSMLMLAGIGQACFGIMQSSIILLSASDEMRSRTMGILVLAIGADPFGKLLTGSLVEFLGAPNAIAAQATLSAISIVLIAVLLPGLRRPTRSHTEQPALATSE